jgi:tryptophan synthase alpha subunit
MSKVTEIFEANRASGTDTLIGYFHAGFPTFEDSLEACVAM